MIFSNFHISKKQFQLILWRGIFFVVILVVIFNFVWLVPALNDVKDRVFSHQGEIMERVSVEFERKFTDEISHIVNEVAAFPSTRDIIVRGDFNVNQSDILKFLKTRDDMPEYDVIDFLGNEIAKVSNGKVANEAEMNNVASEMFFKEAQEKEGVYMEVIESEKGSAPFIIASRQMSFEDGRFYGVVKLTVDSGKYINGFSAHLKEEDNESVYITDRQGFIIDHYDRSILGKSTDGNEFIKGSFEALEQETGKYEHYSGVYVNSEGVKMQAISMILRPFGFLVVFEEPYAEAWGAWRKILFLSFSGVTFLTLLLIFLVRNTIYMMHNADELLKKQKQTAIIVSNLVSGIIQFDKDFRIHLINPKAEELLGIGKKDVLGKIITTGLMKEDPKFESIVQVMYPSVARVVKKITTKEGQPKIIEMTVQRPFEIDLQVVTIPLLDDEKKTVGFLKVLRDISREKAISKTKSEFISVAAHQLRTPLSAIKWVFKMLLDGDVGKITKEQMEFLQKGYDSNERIIQLVGDMLSVARIEEGRFGYEFYYVDPVEIIKKTIKAFEIKAEERNISVNVEIAGEKIQPIKMDPAKIELVLQNLIDNAIKYTPKGGSVTIKTAPVDKFIEISIKDTGVGVPKEQVNRLFSKFFRGANVVKMQTEGTGLGLFIAKNIVQRHGGNIWIETEEGKGTTFFFTLPTEEALIPEHEIITSDTSL